MQRQTIRLLVAKDRCLGHEVYRGSAPAGQLFAASWIDFHDPVNNPRGYQRPIDIRRSQAARNYANDVPDAFWPESIFAIRDNAELDVDDYDDLSVEATFIPIEGTNGRFGTLEVTFNPEASANIGGTIVPFRRAFAQVDCQHRLGSMEDSDKEVTFCIFPKLTGREEAIVFRTINAKQRKISTSLVDAIILLTDANPPVHLKWAWHLGIDPGSPYNNKVYTGGRGRPPTSHYITLAGLRQTLEVLVPRSAMAGQDPDLWYVFVRNFWAVVHGLWPKEFEDGKNYKLQTTPGQRGLARFGRHIFTKVLPTQDTRAGQIKSAFANEPGRIDWSSTGPLQLATGKGGEREVYRELEKKYGLPA